MNDFSNVKTVWVDLDDTIIDFEANSRAALAEVYVTQGLDKWFETSAMWIECYEAYNKYLWTEYAAGRITRGELRLDRFAHPFTEAGMPKYQAEKLSQRLDPLYLDALACKKRLVEGATGLLMRLRGRGYTVGVLSNGFAEVQHRKIESAGLTGMIDCVVLSDDIGVTKPDRRIFEYAAVRGGYPSPESNLMIGDNLSTDIEGALGAGWSGIWFDRHDTRPDIAEALAVSNGVRVTDLTQAAEIICGDPSLPGIINGAQK